MIDTERIKKFATCFGYEFSQEGSKPSVVIVGECHDPIERCCQEGFIKEFRPKYVLIEKLRALSYDPETDCIKFRDDATKDEEDLLQLKDFEDDDDYYKKMSKKYNIQLIGCDVSLGELNRLPEDLGIQSFGRGDFDDIRFDDAREKKMGEIVLNCSRSSSELVMVIIGHLHARYDSKIHEKLKGYIDYICIWSKKAVNEIQKMKICDKLKEHYNILEKEYPLCDCPNGKFKQTISKDGNDIGGIEMEKLNKEGNIVGIKAIALTKNERDKGYGRCILAWIFCNQKIAKILVAPVDKSRCFWEKMGGAEIKCKGDYDCEIIREKFFEENIDKIKSCLKNSDFFRE